MRQSDLHSFKLDNTIAPVTIGAGLTGDVTKGSTIDLQGFEAATLVFQLGTIAHADTTGAIIIEESDTDVDGDFTTVAAGDILGDDVLTALVIADSGATRKKGYIGTKRYIRAKATITTGAATGSFPMSVVAMLGHARNNPQA